MSDTARERREYVFDAWADVAVTAAFVAGALLSAYLDQRVSDQSLPEQVTLTAFEVGTVTTALNHLALMLWHRTLIGSGMRRLWSWWRARSHDRDGDGGGGATGRGSTGGSTGPAGSPPPSPPGGAQRSSGAVLTHPASGYAGSRAATSMLVGVGAAACYGLFQAIRQFTDAGSVLVLVVGGILVLATLLRDRLTGPMPTTAHVMGPVSAWFEVLVEFLRRIFRRR